MWQNNSYLWRIIEHFSKPELQIGSLDPAELQLVNSEFSLIKPVKKQFQNMKTQKDNSSKIQLDTLK